TRVFYFRAPQRRCCACFALSLCSRYTALAPRFTPYGAISRLARSTCCQRPNRLPPERSVSIECEAPKRLTSSNSATQATLSGGHLPQTFQTYRELLLLVNPQQQLFAACCCES